MWWLRSTLNALQIALHLAEKQAEQERFHRWCFDIGSLPIPDDAYKAARGIRDASKLDLVVVHVTAVNGGFGTSAAARKRWRKSLDSSGPGPGHYLAGGMPESILAQLIEVGDITVDEQGKHHVKDPELLARRLATWERYRRTPYHQIASQTGDSLANRALSQRSYHAGSGNDGAGLAIDCGPSEKLSEGLITTGRWSLHKLVDRMQAAGASGPIRVQPHRCFSSSRTRDTDAIVWQRIVKPVVRERDELWIDYHLKRDTGRPIPIEWDEDALYDLRGRRL